ncbi:MAG: hypothetical protein ABIQ40_02070 [Bacteroidia bacterium]
MNWKKIIWSITKTVFLILWKLLLLCIWGCCEFLAVTFRAFADWLKNYITKNNRNK